MIILLTLIIGIMELARAMYICNTLQEVTRRAAALAANTDFSDAAAMQRVRERAIFRTAPGFLAFANPVTDAHINIDYLAVTPDGASLVTTPIPKGSLPVDPARNQEVCTGNPNDAACIRWCASAFVCREAVAIPSNINPSRRLSESRSRYHSQRRSSLPRH